MEVVEIEHMGQGDRSADLCQGSQHLAEWLAASSHRYGDGVQERSSRQGQIVVAGIQLGGPGGQLSSQTLGHLGIFLRTERLAVSFPYG
jgi:hypothetical protein